MTRPSQTARIPDGRIHRLAPKSMLREIGSRPRRIVLIPAVTANKPRLVPAFLQPRRTNPDNDLLSMDSTCSLAGANAWGEGRFLAAAAAQTSSVTHLEGRLSSK